MSHIPKGLKSSRKEISEGAKQAHQTEDVKELFKELGQEVDNKTREILKIVQSFAVEYEEDGKIDPLNKALTANARTLKQLGNLAGLLSTDPEQIAKKFGENKIEKDTIDNNGLEVFQKELQDLAEVDEVNASLAEFGDLNTARREFEEVEEALSERETNLRTAVNKLTDIIAIILPRLQERAGEVAVKVEELASVKLPNSNDFKFNLKEHKKMEDDLKDLVKSISLLQGTTEENAKKFQRAESKNKLKELNAMCVVTSRRFVDLKNRVDQFCPALFDIQRSEDHDKPALIHEGNIQVACEEDPKGASHILVKIQKRLAYAQEISKEVTRILEVGTPDADEIVRRFNASKFLKSQGIELNYGDLVSHSKRLLRTGKLLTNAVMATDIRFMKTVLDTLVSDLQKEVEAALHAENVYVVDKPPRELAEYTPGDAEKKLDEDKKRVQELKHNISLGNKVINGAGRELYRSLQDLLMKGQQGMKGLVEATMNQETQEIDSDLIEFLPGDLQAAIVASFDDENLPVLEQFDQKFFTNALEAVSSRTNVENARKEFAAERTKSQQKLLAALQNYFKAWVVAKGRTLAQERNVINAKKDELKNELEEKKKQIYHRLNELREIIARISGAVGEQLQNVTAIQDAVTKLHTTIIHAGHAMKALGMKPSDLVTDENARTLAGAALICRNMGVGGIAGGAELLLPMAADDQLGVKVAKKNDGNSTALVPANLSDSTGFGLALASDSPVLQDLKDRGRQNFLVHQASIAGQAEDVVKAIRDTLLVKGAAVREVAGTQAANLAKELNKVFSTADGAVQRYRQFEIALTQQERLLSEKEAELRKARDYKKTSKDYVNERKALVEKPGEENPYATAKETLRDLEEAIAEYEAEISEIQSDSTIPGEQMALELTPLTQALENAKKDQERLKVLRDQHYREALGAVDRELTKKYEIKILKIRNSRDSLVGNVELLRSQLAAYQEYLPALATVCARMGGLYARMATSRDLANSTTGVHMTDMGDLAEFFSGLTGKLAQINRYVRTENDRDFHGVEESLHFLEEVILPIVEQRQHMESGEFAPQASIIHKLRDPEALQKGVREAAQDIIRKGEDHLDPNVIDLEVVKKLKPDGSTVIEAGTPANSETETESSPHEENGTSSSAKTPKKRRRRVDF